MFINRALPCGSRTIDQMRQAARSCKQNIVEGVSDGTVSAEMCITLLGVARGSVKELREDYTDFLRQHKYEIWGGEDTRTMAVRNYSRAHYEPREYVDKCETRSDETVANIMLTLIFQMEAMLAKVLKAVEADFIANGDIKEKYEPCAPLAPRLLRRPRPIYRMLLMYRMFLMFLMWLMELHPQHQ